jgi:hypothetical protein
VQWFWEILSEFTNQERSLFLRFVWGRTRLPRTIEHFRGRDFVLQVINKYLFIIKIKHCLIFFFFFFINIFL